MDRRRRHRRSTFSGLIVFRRGEWEVMIDPSKRPLVKWYTLAIAISRAPKGTLEALRDLTGHSLSPPQICSLRKLARVQPTVGNLIDELHAPWRVVRYIVHGSGPAEQFERARVALAELVERRKARQEAETTALQRALLEALEESVRAS